MMPILSLLSLPLAPALAAALAVSPPAQDPAPAPQEPTAEDPGTTGARAVEVRDDLGQLFADHGVSGALWIEDLSREHAYAWRPEVAEQAFLPASTFKILNSLIALETGAVASVDEVIPWDGADRGWSEWNKDHCMRSAIRVSAVWFYQELARRIGEERMADFVKRARYGNANIGGKIDTFWLDGDLRITPRQQIDFLRRLRDGSLPFDKKHLDAVRSNIEIERGDGYVIRAKTGWAISVEPNTGWYVGYVERGEDAWFFATYVAIEQQDREQAKARVAITHDALRRLDVIAPRPETTKSPPQ